MCKVEGCDSPVAGQGYCGTHWSRAMRRGEIQLLPKSTEYKAVHTRLVRARGVARASACIVEGCDTQAKVWAWQRTGPSRTGPYGRRGYDVTWGTDIADYAPMCLLHAGYLDHGGTLTHCPNGHDRATTEKGARGNCLQCKRDGDAARKRPHIAVEALWEIARRVDVRSAKHVEDRA